jgi:muramoyltetrapeptide carboxypeptidase
LKVPAFYGAMIGHIENKLTLPIGLTIQMDASKGQIMLLEGAVG